jgi:hypothetical protein
LHRAQRTQNVELVPGMHRPDLSGIHGLGHRSPRTEAPPPPFQAIHDNIVQRAVATFARLSNDSIY